MAAYADTDHDDRGELAQARTISGINFLIGVWMIISPYILNYSSTAAYWSQVITGIVVAILSLARLAVPRLSMPSWLNGIAGIWLIISPFILSYNGADAYWNEIIFGIILAILAFSNVASVRHHHGHPVAR